MVQTITTFDHKIIRSKLLVHSNPKPMIHDQDMFLIQLNHNNMILGLHEHYPHHQFQS